MIDWYKRYNWILLQSIVKVIVKVNSVYIGMNVQFEAIEG